MVIDTNLYIDWLSARQHEAVLFQRDAVKCLSALVLLELRAGARVARDRRLVDRMTTPFARLLTCWLLRSIVEARVHGSTGLPNSASMQAPPPAVGLLHVDLAWASLLRSPAPFLEGRTRAA